MLECKILCIPHSEGPTGLLSCGPLVNLSSLVEEASWESEKCGCSEGGRWWKAKMKTTPVIPKFSLPDLSVNLSPSLLLGKQLFMVRVGEVVQRYPDKCLRP